MRGVRFWFTLSFVPGYEECLNGGSCVTAKTFAGIVNFTPGNPSTCVVNNGACVLHGAFNALRSDVFPRGTGLSFELGDCGLYSLASGGTRRLACGFILQ